MASRNGGENITRKRPASAPLKSPWRNPNATQSKPLKKGVVTLHHTSLETSVSKRAPYAPRTMQSSSAHEYPKVVNGKSYIMREYNSMEDPHLADYYARKLGLLAGLTEHASKKTKKPKKGNVTYKLSVVTGDKKSAGTDAKVMVQLRGTKGKFVRPLQKQSEDQESVSGGGDGSNFVFAAGSTEVFFVKGIDVGDLIALEVEHDGLERKQGWFLEDITVTSQKTNQSWVCPCHNWLSLFESDCQIKRVLKPAGDGQVQRVVYEVQVITSDKRGAGTDAHVFLTLFGSRGQTPQVQLVNRNVNTFERGQTDIFKIKTKWMGRLKKLTIEHDNTGFAPGWHLEKVIITNLQNTKEKFFFPCDKWLAKDEDDGQIVRQLLATKSLDNLPTDQKYKIVVHTGDVRGAGTDANVYITMFGKESNSTEYKLNDWKNNFERNKTDTFEVSCIPLGRLTKIRIGHDNSGLAPGWYLDKVTITDGEGQAYEFPCSRWFSKSEDDGQISRELLVAGSTQIEGSAGFMYHIHVTTGDVRNAGTNARVFVILYGGEEGEADSGKLWLEGDRDKFERGRTDVFTVECADELSPLHHITVGHDNSSLGAGWYLEKMVVESPTTGIVQTFFCRKWLADDEDDHLYVRDLYEDMDRRQQRDIKHLWNVWIWTSDVAGAGTDAKVFVVLYGSKGKTEETLLGNESDNFERNQLDKFKVEMKAVGKPYKLRIGHDNSKPYSAWHLDKLEMENVTTKSKYSFKCGRWLSRTEDDGEIMRELPAQGNKIKPLPVLIYQVMVYTGDKRGAGTDANVFLNIFGERGDTGQRALLTSKTSRNKFERNQVDEFAVEAVSLGQLNMIRIGHDGKHAGAGWFLDKVTIKSSEEDATEYIFPCKRWLAVDEDDGQIVRELPAGEHGSLLKTTSYKVAVKTGDVRGAGTDANAYIHIFGENGDTGQLRLRRADNTKNKFERARTDLFSVEAMDIGKIKKVILGHDGKGIGAGWFVDSVSIDIASRGELVVFPCHRWLAEDEDDGLLERELFPGEEKKLSKKVPYEVTILTSDIRGAGTNANVFLVLYGEKGKSDEFWLRNKTDNFERGQEDKFKVESDDIGSLTKIRVGHDNAGFSSAWHLNRIYIQCLAPAQKAKRIGKRKSDATSEKEPEDVRYVFVCNRWFAKDEDDKEIVRELVPTDEEGNPLETSSLEEIEYIVHVYTGDVRGSGTNSNVFATIYGEQGDSGERKLESSETHVDKFERNQEDIFKMKCVSLGALAKLKIRHDNSGLKSAWFLDRVEVQEGSGGERVIFPCNRWLATDEDDGQICRELVAVDSKELKRRLTRKQSRKSVTGGSHGDTIDLEQKAAMTTYEILVTTGDVKGAGTDANVYVTLFGENGDTGKVQLKTSKTNKDKFERKQMDLFSVEAVDIGPLTRVRIGHDNKGGFAGWYLDKVEVDAPSLGRKWVFPAGRWLDKDKEDGKLEVDLYPEQEKEESYRPHVPYEITVYTSDISSAGTDATVYVVLYGLGGICTEQIDLTESKKKRKECFNRGSVDVFVRELEDIGEIIEKVRVGHDGKGFRSGWHLNKIEVRRLNEDGSGSTTHVFPCNRWLAKGEDDGAIVRELVPSKVTEETVDKHGELQLEEKRVDALALQAYKIHVFTGDVKSAGTDANVFITLMGENGDTGERSLTKSETHRDKFERGQEDVFAMEAVDLGYIHKVIIRHDNAMLNPSWFLDRVEVISVAEGRRFIFICERWLSKTKDDGKIKRSLYEKNYEGDRFSLQSTMSNESLDRSHSFRRSTSMRSSGRGSTSDLTKGEAGKLRRFGSKSTLRSHGGSMRSLRETIPYTVRVTTGEESDHGTKANAFIVLMGANTTSEKIPLELVGKDSFASGSVEAFSVESPDIGDIMKIEFGHDGYKPTDSWYVQLIEVDAPTTGKRYTFPCQCWLGKDKDDGKTSRIFSVQTDNTVSYTAKIPYEVTLYTGDVKSGGTDAKIALTVFGTKGASSEFKLEKGEDRFERGSVDLFRLEVEDIDELTRLRIGHDGKGSRPSWFLDKVVFLNLNTEKTVIFKCNRWFSKSEDDGRIVRDIAAEIDGSKVADEVTYTINVHTGDIRNGGTDANVFLIIFGETGDSGELSLKNSETHRDKFERNQVDVFKFTMLGLGELTKIRIWHDNKFMRSAWFLASVSIHDSAKDKSYEFPCNRWLAKSEDDGSLVRELPCANKVEEEPSKKGKRSILEVTLVTAKEEKAGTEHNAWLLLFDEEGKKSNEILLENSAKQPLFQAGATDTLKVVSRPLGKLVSAIVGLRPRKGYTPKGKVKREFWQLVEIKVKDLDTNHSYVFECKKKIPLAPGSEDGVELEVSTIERSRVESIRDLRPVHYDVKVFTADVPHAGTDANVSITIYGEHGDTGKRALKKKFKDLFERGNVDDFKIEALDLGKLTKIRIEHDNKGFGAGWMLDRVEITNPLDNVITVFPCNQWLDKKKGDKQICREILAVNT